MKRVGIAPTASSAGGLVSATTSANASGEQQGPVRVNQSSTNPTLIEDATFNSKLARPNKTHHGSTIKVEIKETLYSNPRRYLHTRPSDKSAVLNEQLDRYATSYAKSLGLNPEDLGNPGVINPVPITVVGRVVSTMANEDGCSSEQSIGSSLPANTLKTFLLESSRKMGSGCRVALDANSAKSSTLLFPGQIVALEGINSDGRTFVISDQKNISYLAPSNKQIATTLSTETTNSFTILCASGPFGIDQPPDDNSGSKFDFTLFEKLINFAYEQRPNVIILTGPFVSMENTLFRTGKIHASFTTPEQMFARDFMGRLKMLLVRVPEIQVILVPSTKDLLSDPVFPQPPLYSLKSLIDPSISNNIHFAPNPAIIDINRVDIFVSSADCFLPLAMNEVYHRHPQAGTTAVQKEDFDRIQRLVKAFHQQASFYPQSPAPSGINIDYNLLPLLEFPNYPDIFLGTSQLCCFARSIQNNNPNHHLTSLYVNCGQFCRKQAAGTAAIVSVVNHERRVDFYQF